jgi:hypothetical protein
VRTQVVSAEQATGVGPGTEVFVDVGVSVGELDGVWVGVAVGVVVGVAVGVKVAVAVGVKVGAGFRVTMAVHAPELSPKESTQSLTPR